jgi:hypothetical protein
MMIRLLFLLSLVFTLVSCDVVEKKLDPNQPPPTKVSLFDTVDQLEILQKLLPFLFFATARIGCNGSENDS